MVNVLRQCYKQRYEIRQSLFFLTHTLNVLNSKGTKRYERLYVKTIAEVLRENTRILILMFISYQ